MRRKSKIWAFLILILAALCLSCGENSSETGNPQLAISPESLEFGVNQAELRFTVANSGTGSLSWTITESMSWVSVVPGNGQTGSEIDTVLVFVNRPGLSDDTLSGAIAVQSNGGAADVGVTAVDTAVAATGIYAEFFLNRRLTPHGHMGLMRRDLISARFDSTFSPCNYEVALQADTVTCGQYYLEWDDSLTIYEYSQSMHSSFIDLGANYAFGVHGNEYVPSIADSIPFPLYEPYLSDPVDGDSVSRSIDLIVTWENSGEGTIFVALARAADSACVMPGNPSGIDGLFIEPDNDGEFTIVSSELAGLPPDDYVLELDYYAVRNIDFEDYDPRSFILARTISRISLHLD